MSSENRSSSGVRNLRSIFEDKASLDSQSPDSRGRSPNSHVSSDKENAAGLNRPTSKVRASFVPVDAVAGSENMSAAVMDGGEDGAELKRESSAGLRRGSFSEIDGDGALTRLKKTVSEEIERNVIPEAALESAAGTPLRKPVEDGMDGYASPLAGKMEGQPENPDKHETAAEEEVGDIKPADPASEDAVSGGEALPPVAEDLRASTKATPSKGGQKADTRKPTANGRPAAISTKAHAKPSPSAPKSSTSQPKTPQSPLATHKAPAKKASRSSLTAPTAASMARSGAAPDKPTKTSPTSSKTKPREVTKPVSLSSHLTAPTAASRAKHDGAPAPAANLRASTTSKPRISSSSSKPTPRSSLAAQQHRPESRDTHQTAAKTKAPADGSFLERMMKPTAASASKTHDKPEVKTSPKSKTAASRPKVNGVKPAGEAARAETSKAAAAAPTAAAEQPNETHKEVPRTQQPVAETLEKAGAVQEVPQATTTEAESTPQPTSKGTVSALTNGTGSETPIPHTNGAPEADATLEATPAALGEEVR